MVNHPNRAPVSHDDMVQNHTNFYPAQRAFKPKALRIQGQVRIAGGINVVPLWICVEWDSARVLVGYHWQPAVDGTAVKLGTEEWFKAGPRVTAQLGTHTERRMTCMEPVDVILQDHDFILKITRECQAILDAGPITEAVKQQIREKFIEDNSLNTADSEPS